MSCKEIRISIGGDILVAMAANDEFPIGNVHRLARTMQEYFVSEGFEDTLVEFQYTWRPTEDYWMHHQQEIRDYLRKEKRLFLEYRREHNQENGSTFDGSWQFLRKGSFEKVMEKEQAGLQTRKDSYNERIKDGRDKWNNLSNPYLQIAELPAETN